MSELENITVRYVSLPITVKGFISCSPDGEYNIFINSNYSEEMQQFILRHELRHIENDDFNSLERIEAIEKRASLS